MALNSFFDRMVARYLTKHAIPIEEAEAILLEELEMLIQNPPALKIFCGSFRKDLDAIIDEKISAKQRKVRFKDKKAQVEAEKALDESLKAINYKLLPKAHIKSGYIGVYTNSDGWRARVKAVDGNWQFLATHKYPEQAAWERYNWHLANNPLENLDGELLHYFNVYVDTHTNWTFDEALSWSKSQAAFGSNAYSGSDGLTENERTVKQAMPKTKDLTAPKSESKVVPTSGQPTMEDYKRAAIAERTEIAIADANAEKDHIVVERTLNKPVTKLTRQVAKEVIPKLKEVENTKSIRESCDEVPNYFDEIKDVMELEDD